jgi:hypothetical protein
VTAAAVRSELLLRRRDLKRDHLRGRLRQLLNAASHRSTRAFICENQRDVIITPLHCQ